MLEREMQINSYMVKIPKILLFTLLGLLSADYLPEGGEAFNYTHIYFQWDQIPDAEWYNLSLINVASEEEYEVQTQSNSNLVLDFIQWNSTYSWDVTTINENGENVDTSENRTFSINPLPDYFPDDINVSIYDESLYQDGITIMDYESLNFSGGLDKDGNPIWFADKDGFEERFVFTQFLKNGNMVGFGPGVGYEIDLDGHIVFETPPDVNSVHHDFNKTSNNTYFLVSATVENQYCPEECNPNLPDEIPWQGDIFREIDMDGNEIWSWNTFDYYDLTEYNPYYIETYTGAYEMDWTHSNSVFIDENSESVFVSVRNLSRITKIDYASKELIWNMGQTDFMNEIYFEEDLNFSQQHSVQVLDNGNLLFFDNHRYLSPELSRCIEVEYNEDAHSASIVWEHELPLELFSGSRGECDRLDNGNTLITAGRTGNTLEVTPNNEVVWHLEVENSGFDVTMYRSERIPNLHPIAYSFTLANLTGSIENSYVDPTDGLLEATIHNNSWGTGWFNYTLLINEVEISSDNIFVNPFENSTLNIDLSTFDINTGSILTLEIYPENAPEKMQSVNFSIYSSVLTGDLNNDGTLNILDIVILANLILTGDSSNPAGDLNNDGSQNILDIVLLINIILDGL